MKKILASPLAMLLIALALGICTGLYPIPWIITASESIGTIFVNLLKLISVPIIFLAIVSTITGLQDKTAVRFLGGKVLKYTLITTVIAATIGLSLFLLIKPVQHISPFEINNENPYESISYWEFVLNSVPSNIIAPFSEGNVIAILFLALLASFAILSLPKEQKTLLNNLFTTLFAATLAITRLILRCLPIALWAFVTQFIVDIMKDLANSRVWLCI